MKPKPLWIVATQEGWEDRRESWISCLDIHNAILLEYFPKNPWESKKFHYITFKIFNSGNSKWLSWSVYLFILGLILVCLNGCLFGVGKVDILLAGI